MLVYGYKPVEKKLWELKNAAMKIVGAPSFSYNVVIANANWCLLIAVIMLLSITTTEDLGQFFSLARYLEFSLCSCNT